MRKYIGYFVLGFLAYALSLLATVPAERVYAFAQPLLAEKSPGLGLYGLEGTLWDGRARSVSFNEYPLGTLQWKLSIPPLLLGRVSVDWQLQSESGYIAGHSGVSLSGAIVTEDAEGRLPVADAARHIRLVPVPLDGMLSLRIDRLALENGKITGADGVVMWHTAAVSGSTPLVLGDLGIEFATDETGKIEGKISDKGGPLQISGTVTLTQDGQYHMAATLGAGPDAPPELRQSLSLMGRPDPKGRYKLNFSGKL